MLKVVVTLAVLLVAVICQGPPAQPLQNCVAAPTNVTGICQPFFTYTVLSTADITAAINTAQVQYDSNKAKISNPSADCQSALAAFSCQSALPRCGRYTNYGNVLQSRCDKVNTACGISGFPTNFTGNACVVNRAVSVDGPALVCYGSNYVAPGATCNTVPTFFDPKEVLPATVSAPACVPVSFCNTTTTSTCVVPNKIGDSCVSTCVTGTAQPGSLLTCSSGTCQYTGKRFNNPCTSNSECLSSNCAAGKCLESPLFGACNTSLNCQDGLYCDTKNNTCYTAPGNNELCGFVQPNWSNVPCAAGLTCVRTSNSTSRCSPNANVGQACSAFSGATVYDSPLCSPSTVSIQGPATCTNGICSLPVFKALTEACNATNICNPTIATCKYPSGSTQGTCVAPTEVTCDTLSVACNAGQRCNCVADQTLTGTCGFNTANPSVACAAQSVSLQNCLLINCGSVATAFFPYDGFSCGALKCLVQTNAYFCCVKTTVGTGYVAPFGQPIDPCVTPTPTPGPTTTPGPLGPTTTPGPLGPTTTGTPGRSSRSGSATVAVSFVAFILAVVAFL